jgi:hypothetical protein
MASRKRPALNMREDLVVFLDCYGRSQTVARSSFCAMLEASFSLGLTTILLQTLAILSHWSLTGKIENETLNRITPIFLDCSVGTDVDLRAFSERSSADVRQIITQIPSILMYARLLDFYVRNESDSEKADLPSSAPDATGWMELLGSFLNQTHEESRDAERFFRSKSRQLVEAAANDLEAGFRADLLSAEGATSNLRPTPRRNVVGGFRTSRGWRQTRAVSLLRAHDR